MIDAIPSGAVGASIGVLLYSTICATLTTLLTGLLISFGEAWSCKLQSRGISKTPADSHSDVTIFSGFTALSSIASVGQQIHYATAWRVIKEAQFHRAVDTLTNKGLAFGGAAHPVDIVLFFIRSSSLPPTPHQS